MYRDKPKHSNTRHKSHKNIETDSNTVPFRKTSRQENLKTDTTNKIGKHSRRDKDDSSLSKSSPDLDLFNLKIHEKDNDLEIVSHRKTQKLISTDLNTIITGSATPVRGQPAKYLRNGKQNNSGYILF
jgi:hypothetical protein